MARTGRPVPGRRHIEEADVDDWVQTASILHSNGDALDIAVKDARIVGVRGRTVDRVNKGRADPKDLYGGQANNSPDRLKRQLVRDENGELVEASWDEAMGRIVDRSKRLLEQKGPLAFGFYTSGQLFLEEYYTLGVIGEAGIGTPHMDGNTRLCTADSAAALEENFGSDILREVRQGEDHGARAPLPRALRRNEAGGRDMELLEVVNACEGQTAIQIKWLRTRMKQAAPQALLVGSFLVIED